MIKTLDILAREMSHDCKYQDYARSLDMERAEPEAEESTDV
jgi:hypothetical protein